MSRDGMIALGHSEERIMKNNILMAGAVVAALAIPFAANAEDGATTGAVGGAVAGAVVGGPVGAIVGGSADEANANRVDPSIKSRDVTIRSDGDDGKGTRKARAAKSQSGTTS